MKDKERTLVFVTRVELTINRIKDGKITSSQIMVPLPHPDLYYDSSKEPHKR